MPMHNMLLNALNLAGAARHKGVLQVGAWNKKTRQGERFICMGVSSRWPSFTNSEYADSGFKLDLEKLFT